MYNISIEQEKILKKLKNFFSNEIKINKRISLSDYYYFCSWVNNYGNWCLKIYFVEIKIFLENFILT